MLEPATIVRSCVPLLAPLFVNLSNALLVESTQDDVNTFWVSVSVKDIVPSAFGNTIVRSADTVFAFNKTSKSFAALPSNTTPFDVDNVSTFSVVVVPVTIRLPLTLIVVSSPESPNTKLSSPLSVAKAAVMFALSVTSALASIAFNLLWSVSVNTFESVAASTAALISALVWSAVAEASIAFNLLWSASVNTLESDADSTNARISALVWSAVADASIASSLFFRVVVKFCCERPPAPTEYSVLV